MIRVLDPEGYPGVGGARPEGILGSWNSMCKKLALWKARRGEMLKMEG